MNYKTITLTGLLALALAAGTTLHAAGTGFIRPVLAYVSPDAEGYDDTAYIGVDAGTFLGKNLEHEISAEIGFIGWEFDERQGGVRAEGEEFYVPVLASYRYYATVSSPSDKQTVRLFFGPSLGFTEATYEVRVTGPGVNRSDESSELAFTFALNAGVEIAFNDKLSLNLGYRYLHIDGTETELFGSTVDLDDSKAHVIFAGLTCRF